MSPVTFSPPRRIVIATRRSALALIQSELIRDQLASLYPNTAIELLGLSTEGDRVVDRPLADVGGKGLFIKELEQAMTDGRADVAVHSLKDVPTMLPEGFTLAAITAREDPRDAFVSSRYQDLDELPAEAVVGTSSLRREAQLRERYPSLIVHALRGNVNTRLRKLDTGTDGYAAIVLAVAGLKRLQLSHRITRFLTIDESLPAIGQGALAIECEAKRHDLVAALAQLNDDRTAVCVRAERAFGERLAGSCRAPLAAYGEWNNGGLSLRGLVASPDGQRVLRGTLDGNAHAPEALGHALADDFLTRGAAAILATT